jgi:type IV secretory pathway VirB10-like protein
MRLTTIVFVLFSLFFLQTLANEGCSPALNSQDCQNPQTHVCTKILLGTTAAAKARGKYFYQCLPREWATAAKQKVESVTGILSETPVQETKKVLSNHLLQVPVEEVVTQKAKPEEKVQETKPLEKVQETAPVAQAKPVEVKQQEVAHQEEAHQEEAHKEEAKHEEAENDEEDDEDEKNDQDTESYEEDF